MSEPLDFLLVIPAYNESRRLPAFLAELAPALEAKTFRSAILIVDDGSQPAEREALLAALAPIRALHPIVLEPLCLEANVGKGGAIMAGWGAGIQARRFAFVDADGAIPDYEVVRLFEFALTASDPRVCYFASRIRMLGRSVDRNLRRHLMGRVFATLVGTLVHPGVYDSQCGFKIIDASAFPAIRALLTEQRFAFDVELLATLIDSGFPVEEVPIHWRDVPGSKVSMLKDTVRMALTVFRIRARRDRWKAAAARELKPAAAPALALAPNAD